MLVAAGLPVGVYEVITDRQWRSDKHEALRRIEALGLPVFVKPARAGSSVGISKVKYREQLEPAIELARSHDPKVVIEASIEGNRELECGVLGSAAGPRASVVAEIVVRRGHELYDYDAKYVDDSVDLVVPARLTGDIAERAQDLACQAFTALDCEGLARVDMFLAGGQLEIGRAHV